MGDIDEDGPRGNTNGSAQARPNPSSGGSKLPCGHKMGGRNLIVCVDGTANKFGNENTNVIEVYRMIHKKASDNQHTWYNSGIGTYAQPHWKSLSYYWQVLSNWIDMAIAWNFERTVLGAYQWLSDNYEEGDCIFLFGFSRGAFQVRALAAMIDKVGLIHKGNEAQIPFAYELYADSRTAAGSGQATQFKAAFSREVKVHFVGAWDTVSSVGSMKGDRILPGTTDGMEQVCYFRHALALDERRVRFQPEYAHGGCATAPPDIKPNDFHSRTIESSYDTTNIPSTLNNRKPRTLEVWFAGVHSDIGGGNARNSETSLSRPPLRWMAQEAEGLGLRIKPFSPDFASEKQTTFVDSLTGIWPLLEILPFQRRTFSRRPEARGNTTHKPHLGSGRKVHVGQKIHSSSMLGGAEDIPKASLPTGSGSDYPESWIQLRDGGVAQAKGLLEIDMIEYTRTTVKAYSNETDNDTNNMLKRIAEYSTGAQVLYDEIIKAIGRWPNETTPNLSNRCRLLNAAVILLSPKASTLTLRDKQLVRSLFSEKVGQDEDLETAATTFSQRLTNPCILKLDGHKGWVRSVAISSDGMRIVSGAEDRSVRVWDARTGDLLRELKGHTDWVWSLALSFDGTRIVSGSDDRSVRVWDVQTGELLVVLKGHTGNINSVAFSADGRRIVSGSNDQSVRVWDAQTGMLLMQLVGQLVGHTDYVRTVAFSSDGTRIASGSDDNSFRIWDAYTGNLLMKCEGHTDSVRSVAFSSDGTHIVSGSDDDSIWIWDAHTGALVKKLQARIGSMCNVSFSSDGDYLLSGSDDSIQIWDVRTGALQTELGGPRRSVLSAAFSSDGKRIVSGSSDGSVRVWDIEGLL